MNDTETEARRLLAAATQDMPPGIDLPGGFVAARRRDRSRRTHRGAVLLAGIAVAAASVTAVTLTMGSGSAPSELATVTSALTHTLTQSYHLSEQDSYYFIVNGQIRNPHHDACTTEADPVRHLLAASCSTWNPMTGKAGPIVREVGGYTYYYTPVTTGTHGKHWQRVLTASLPPPPCCADNGFTTATPQQMLAQIKKGRHGHRGRTRLGKPVTVTPPPADQTYPLP